MIVSRTRMFEISWLALLARMFDMKDLVEAKTNLGHGNMQRWER
jgi:hypothetical protein